MKIVLQTVTDEDIVVVVVVGVSFSVWPEELCLINATDCDG